MNLNGDVAERIKDYIPVYETYRESDRYLEDLEERKKKEAMINELLAKDQLQEMTELEFGQVMSSLWALQMWSNKSYLVDSFLNLDSSINCNRAKIEKYHFWCPDIKAFPWPGVKAAFCKLRIFICDL